MKRRNLLRAVAPTVVASWTTWTTAQTRLARVGVLFMTERYGPESKEWRAVVDALALRGYVIGRNISFEPHISPDEDSATLEALAVEVARTRPTVIFAFNSQSALAAKKATSDLPIVVWGSGDPVALGLVASLEHPGGNITGNSSQSFSAFAKGIEVLFELMGGFKKLAVIISIGESTMAYFNPYLTAVKMAVHTLGADYKVVKVTEAIADWEPLMRNLKMQHVDAAFLGNGPYGDLAREQADMFIKHRLPTVGNAHAGALLQYTNSRKEVASLAADYVDQIIRGAKPSDLPVQQPKQFELIINMRTARALQLQIPRSILLRASEVIE